MTEGPTGMEDRLRIIGLAPVGGCVHLGAIPPRGWFRIRHVPSRSR